MPELTPFSGLRYDGADLSRLAAPPYDVIDEADRARLEGLDPHNAVRLILPRDGDAEDRYASAASSLAAWERAGILRRDARPTFTVVRMRFDDGRGSSRTTVGVVGALALPAEGDDGDVLPHERTMAKAKSDRLSLLRATRANLDPIWGLSLASGLSDLLACEGPPARACTDAEGGRHEAWIMDDPEQIAAVSEVVAAAPLVLADGHHRYETALRYRSERDGAVGDAGASAIMTFVVELSDDQLCIRPIHRLVHLPEGVDPRGALADDFEVEALALAGSGEDLAAAADDAAALGLADRQGFALLHAREGVRRATEAAWPRPVAGIDAALVETGVRPRLEGAEWEYLAGADAVVDAVRSGAADAALLLRPVGVAETRAVAQAGARMPQKTTFFHPKPRTGLVFRTLDPVVP